MAKPKKLPSGQWNARGYFKDPVTGKEYRPSFTATTKAEAARMVANWQAEKERLTRPQEMKIAECIDRYIMSKENTLSPATIKTYRQMQTTRYETIGSIPLNRLTDEDLQRFVSALAEKVSPKTVRNVYGLLISSVKMFSDRTYHITLPQKQTHPLNIPTDNDIKELIDKATPSMKLAIALAAFATLRRGEVCALKYKVVLRDQSAIYVHADIVLGSDGYVYKEMPKTASSVRIIPLPPQVMNMIDDSGDPEEFIYKANPGTIGKNFWKLRNKLGLSCRFHDLRHYSASIMHALGIPDQYIMERGGWSSDSVLKSVYRNSLSDQSTKFQQIANDHFSEILMNNDTEIEKNHDNENNKKNS